MFNIHYADREKLFIGCFLSCLAAGFVPPTFTLLHRHFNWRCSHDNNGLLRREKKQVTLAFDTRARFNGVCVLTWVFVERRTVPARADITMKTTALTRQ